MRYFAFKLSDGGFYSSGHATGQKLHMADILPESDTMGIIDKSVFIQLNIDPNFQLTEIIAKD